MELKTWTRKSNAIKAVEKTVLAMDSKLLDNAYVTGYEAADIGKGAKQAWAVKVYTEAQPKVVEAMQEQLGNIAEVVTTYGGSEHPKPGAEKPNSKKKANNGAGRRGRYAGMKISIIGGKDAANPFRKGSLSYAAFEFVQANPNTKFEDLSAAGVRMRTVTEMLRDGPNGWNGIARATK